MGRLIDAGLVLDNLSGRLESMKDYDAVKDVINNMPTAYDPDKVVEQLNEEKELSYAEFDEYVNEVCPCLDAEYDDLFNKGLERAIEIVKGEYAPEQSCEWSLEDAESNLYVTGCENRELIFEGTPEENGYKYCHYCGRMIKRGGVD